MDTTLRACLLLMASTAAFADGAFPDGVAAGDLTSTSVILWTRLERPTAVRAEVAVDPAFATIAASTQIETSAEHDFTVKAEVTGLATQTTYFYRFLAMDDGATSPTGNFRTA